MWVFGYQLPTLPYALAFIVVLATPPAEPPSSQPASEPTSADITSVGEAQPTPPGPNQFLFSSYGRMGAFTNQSGKEGVSLNVSSHIPRLEEAPYIELYFGYRRFFPSLGDFMVMVTPAFAGDPFHYTGQFSAQFALRNAYAQVSRVGGSGLYAWIGSRMYRGDDVFLLDFWPLDNLNTLGAAVGYTTHGFDATLHVGASSVLGSNYFQQQIQVADPTFGATTVTTNDRQHLIGSLKLRYDRELARGFAFRAKVYGEAHSLASGTITLSDNTQQTLPADSGYVLGGQFSVFHHPTRSFLHLFLRQGVNLGAYDALSIPFGLNGQQTTKGASETMLALSVGAVILERVTLGVGAYYRAFHVALAGQFDDNDRDEYVADARVNINIMRFWAQSFEFSYERALPHGIQPTLLRQISPEVTKFSIVPMLVSAPDLIPEVTLRLIYTYATSNDDTKYIFPTQDFRYTTRNFHFFGVQAEWLFDKVFE
jgi:maltoporin